MREKNTPPMEASGNELKTIYVGAARARDRKGVFSHSDDRRKGRGAMVLAI